MFSLHGSIEASKIPTTSLFLKCSNGSSMVFVRNVEGIFFLLFSSIAKKKIHIVLHKKRASHMGNSQKDIYRKNMDHDHLTLNLLGTTQVGYTK
jgi:hypothetical protein